MMRHGPTCSRSGSGAALSVLSWPGAGSGNSGDSRESMIQELEPVILVKEDMGAVVLVQDGGKAFEVKCL